MEDPVKYIVKEEFKTDEHGNLVRIENIKPIDLMRDNLVNEIVTKSKEHAAALRAFKRQIFNDVQAFIDLSAERYGVNLGGAKGNVSLLSFDRQYRVQIAIHDYLRFDEGLHAAKALIDECLREWTSTSHPAIHEIINDAFNVDKEGKLNTKSILGLRRLNIDDEKWQRAMQAISDSVSITHSTEHIRIYERNKDGKYEMVKLDVSAIN